jgi:hypothetical protein
MSELEQHVAVLDRLIVVNRAIQDDPATSVDNPTTSATFCGVNAPLVT